MLIVGAVVACTPHPRLGTVIYQHVQVDLATCKTAPAPAATTAVAPTVRVTKNSQSIVFEGRVVLTIHENHEGFPAGSPGPIELEGVSPDGEWILYAIDPQGSASLAADGLALRAIRATGGRSYAVAFGLMHAGYRAWCGGRLVMTTGGDRIAVHAKRLIVTGPPSWKASPLVRDAAVSFGSLACDGDGVVAQEQPNSTDPNFFHTHWSLVRVGFDGSVTRLTRPPKTYTDESPRVVGGILYFVRSRRGNGTLYALQNGKVVGPLLSLGYSLGYYGYQDWQYSVRRSARAPRRG